MKKSVDELKPLMPDAFNHDLGLEVAFKEGYNKAVDEVLKELKKVLQKGFTAEIEEAIFEALASSGERRDNGK